MVKTLEATMRKIDFIEFLGGDFRGPRTGRALSENAARDVASRCRRVERALGIDLDSVSSSQEQAAVIRRIQDAPEALGFSNNATKNARDVQSAVRYYFTFLRAPSA